jgi:hypothetical protein
MVSLLLFDAERGRIARSTGKMASLDATLRRATARSRAAADSSLLLLPGTV